MSENIETTKKESIEKWIYYLDQLTGKEDAFVEFYKSADEVIKAEQERTNRKMIRLLKKHKLGNFDWWFSAEGFFDVSDDGKTTFRKIKEFCLEQIHEDSAK